MIAITSHNEKTKEEYEAALYELRDIMSANGFKNYVDACQVVNKKSTYARNTYSGVLKPEMRNISALQVAMMLDGGYSWFGGRCSKDPDGLSFCVTIYTD